MSVCVCVCFSNSFFLDTSWFLNQFTSSIIAKSQDKTQCQTGQKSLLF